MSRRLKPRVVLPPEPENPGAPPPPTVAISDHLVQVMSRFGTYAPNFLKIQTKHGDLVDFELNDVQTPLERIIQEIKAEGRNVRLLILKARREGISTWVSGRFFWKTTTQKNHYSMIVTHEPEATDFIFKMHKRFLDHIPEFLRPTERYNNKKVLEFNDDKGTGLDSAIRVGTADKEDFGSGQLIHDLHLSELAKYPKHTCTALLLSLLQCVPDKGDTEIIMESTAKGVGGEFYDRYWGAKYRYEFFINDAGQADYKIEINKDADPANVYSAIFIPWFVFHEYQMEPTEELVYTEEEKELVRIYGLTERHIAWRRDILANKCDGKIELFNQEYPSNAMEAFLSDSDNVFDVKKLTERIKVAKPPKATYKFNFGTMAFAYDPKGQIMVWDEPRPTRYYVVSCDPAEGIVGKDNTSIDILDVETGIQVAHFSGIIPPDQCGLLCAYLARRYNEATLAIERNNHGFAVIQKAIDLGYTNLYAEMVVEPPAKPRKRYGFVTSNKSKPVIIDQLASEFRENTDGINNKGTLEEMMFFKQHEDMKLGAEEGHKDDRVVSLAIGKYVISKLPITRKKLKMTQVKPLSYNKSKPRVSAASWT